MLGTILIGDISIHHIRWLRYCSRNSAEGGLLRDNLLDLALTDLDEVRCKVVGEITDHKGLALTLPLSVPQLQIQSRTVWQFRDADWNGLRVTLLSEDWT